MKLQSIFKKRRYFHLPGHNHFSNVPLSTFLVVTFYNHWQRKFNISIVNWSNYYLNEILMNYSRINLTSFFKYNYRLLIFKEDFLKRRRKNQVRQKQNHFIKILKQSKLTRKIILNQYSKSDVWMNSM